MWTSGTGRTGPGWAFTILWLSDLTWNGYFLLWRSAWKLELGSGKLVWRTPLRSGASGLGDISSIRPLRAAPQAVAIEFTGREKTVFVLAAKGLQDFLDELASQAPWIPIRVSRVGRATERWPGRSRYRRE